jgi:hypothetical protein
MTTNNIDLEFLGNIRVINNSKDDIERDKLNKKEIKFYRRRILETTKQLLRNNETNSDIKAIFTDFALKCIQHYKQKDTLTFFDDHTSIKIASTHAKAMKKLNRQDIDNMTQNMFQNIKTVNTIEDLIPVTKIAKKHIIFPVKKNINLKDPKFKKKQDEPNNNI